MGVESIVNVTITREGAGVSQAGFGIPLILGPNAAHADTSRLYTSLTGVLTDFASTTDEYKAAQAMFAQDPSPRSIRIGVQDELATVPEALAAIVADANDWYGLILTSRTEADVLAAAAWAEANDKVFITASSAAALLTTATTDLASQVQDAAYKNTAVFYHQTPSQFADAALMGRFFGADPGAEIVKFLTLAGVTASSLTDSEKANLWAKNGSTYTTVGGVNIVESGATGSGQFLDSTRNLAYLRARVQEAVYGLLVRVNKIPYTDAGVMQVVSEVNGVLGRMVREGVLADSPAPAVTYPRVADVSTADRTARLLPDINFTAREGGAVQGVDVAGVVSV
jgi:hypothetical protein